MFESGKKYQYKYKPDIYKCLWADEKSGLMEASHGGRWSEPQKAFDSCWKEYVEPKVYKNTRRVLFDKVSDRIVVIPDECNIVPHYQEHIAKHIAMVEFTYDIYNGLKVEIHNPIG